MGEKFSGFAKENDGFQGRMVRGGNSEPLNIHLVWGSVRERNCEDLQRNMMDFRGGLCGGRGVNSEPLNIHLMCGSWGAHRTLTRTSEGEFLFTQDSKAGVLQNQCHTTAGGLGDWLTAAHTHRGSLVWRPLSGSKTSSGRPSVHTLPRIVDLDDLAGLIDLLELRLLHPQ